MGDKPRFTTDQAVEFTKKVTSQGGAVTWDVPIGMNGKIADAFVEQLAAVGKAAAAN
jgi:hypothetical protein